MLLEIDNISKSFGQFKALDGVSLSVPSGQIRGVIGPNGSGKSTLFNVMTGVYRPDPGIGSIKFEGKDIADLEAHEIARCGIARTFQMLRVFLGMTVIDNLLIGRHTHLRHSGIGALFGLPATRAEERLQREEMMALLGFLGLSAHADMPAGALSIGQRRLVALGRSIAMKPKLLLLDEPGAGLSPINVESLLSIIVDLRKQLGLTIIIVEHILRLIMDVCDEITVLDHGSKIAEGKPGEVRDNPAVIEAYLGKEMDDAEIRAFFESAAS